MEKMIIPPGADSEFVKEQEMLGKLVASFSGKIIGWNEHIGVYELVPVGTADGDVHAVGFKKFELDRNGHENYLRFSYVSRQLRYLQGEILTILEATIDDERKLKATKDLVKDKFSAKISWVYENCGLPEEEEHSLGELED